MMAPGESCEPPVAHPAQSVGVAPVRGRGRSLASEIWARARGGTSRRAVDEQRYRVLVESLFSSPTSMMLSNAIGAAVPLFCWWVSRDGFYLPIFGAGLVVLVYRTIVALSFGTVPPARRSMAGLRRWDRLFLIGATAFSGMLGCLSFVALTLSDEIPCHIITIVVAIAFASGYVARNAGRPLFVIGQLLAVCVPLCLGLAEAKQPFYGPIAVFIGLFVLTNISVAFSLNRNLVALAEARTESETLAGSLRVQNVTLDCALNSMTHGLVMFGKSLDLAVANNRFAELYRLAGSDVAPGAHLTDLLDRLIDGQVLAPMPARALAELCRRVLGSGQAGSVEIQTMRGETFVVHAEATAEDGILMLTEDATERKSDAARIERLAHTDNLTELPNRFRFTQIVRALFEAGPEAGTSALLYIDLDNFKSINDTLGHEAGDQLLVQVAGRLRDGLGPDEVVARFGGDEFLLLAPAADAEGAMAIGRRVIAAMAAPFAVDGNALNVTTSVGMALVPEHGVTLGDVLRSADMALYAAKAAGRNTVVPFDPAMAAAVRNRRELEQDLRDAWRTGALSLHYQPIVDLASRRTTSFEALMRWHHPTRGAIPPAEFIPIAEETGLIADLGDWAIRRACQDASEWPESVSVAVNVSAVQFRNPKKLIQAVKDALRVSGLPPSRLVLEVTESLLIEDEDASLKAVQALHRIGVRFSLDDFGIGYSSLAYLARYPFSKVKIDRTFARHVTSDGPSRSIIEVVCQLAERLGMRVVVEGIETESQRLEVEALGAEQAQGFLFGRPLPPESLFDRERSAA